MEIWLEVLPDCPPRVRHLVGTRFPLAEGEPIVVGCDPGSDVVLPSPSVSRQHCRLQRRRCGIWAWETGLSGVRVNGVRGYECRSRWDEAIPLRVGDVIET